MRRSAVRRVPEPRVVLVHANAPPVPGGTNVVLARLLEARDAASLDVFTDLARIRRVRRGGELRLDGRYRYFPCLGAVAQLLPALRGSLDALDIPLALAAGVRVAAGLHGKDGRAVLVAPLDSGFSTLATALAARLTGRPYVLMVFDLWEENAYSAVARWTARRCERRLLRGAAGVIAFSGRVDEHYRRKHGVACEVIDTPIEATAETANGRPPADGPLEILVGGAVYWAQEDAVRRLLRVTARMPGVSVTMVGDEEDLRRRGLQADRYEPRTTAQRYRELLRRADVMFVGLSLDSPHPEVVLTATPARLPEAMASGRPLLLHAPAGSHAARYARAHDFAEVVDQPDDDALERGIRALADDPGRATERARRAAALARDRHAVEIVRPAFEELLRAAERRSRSASSTPPAHRPGRRRDRTR